MYDGGSMASPIIGEYCHSTPSSQMSSSNHLFIYFHSDYIDTGTGFKLEYNATSKKPYKVDSCTPLSLELQKSKKLKKTFHAIPISKFALFRPDF